MEVAEPFSLTIVLCLEFPPKLFQQSPPRPGRSSRAPLPPNSSFLAMFTPPTSQAGKTGSSTAKARGFEPFRMQPIVMRDEPFASTAF